VLSACDDSDILGVSSFLEELPGVTGVDGLVSIAVYYQDRSGSDLAYPLERADLFETSGPFAGGWREIAVPYDTCLAAVLQELLDSAELGDIEEAGGAGTADNGRYPFIVGGVINRSRRSTAEPHHRQSRFIDFIEMAQMIDCRSQIARPAQDVEIALAVA